MNLPDVTRGSEPFKLNFAAYKPKRATRVLIIVLGRKAERYDLRTVLEQRVEPVRELPFERGVSGLKGREAIAYLGFVEVLSPINEIGRRKLDVRKESKRQPKRLREPSRFSVVCPSFRISFPVVVVAVGRTRTLSRYCYRTRTRMCTAGTGQIASPAPLQVSTRFSYLCCLCTATRAVPKPGRVRSRVTAVARLGNRFAVPGYGE